MAVFLVEQPTSLQLWHEQIDDIIHSLRQHIDHHREAVSRLRCKALFHCVGNGRSRAYDVMMGAWRANEKFAHRKVFRDGETYDALTPANSILELLIRGECFHRERAIQIVTQYRNADARAPRHRNKQLLER